MEKKQILPLLTVFILAVITIIILFLNFGKENETETTKWLVRVVGSLAASAISIVIPGSIAIGKRDGIRTFAEDNPKIVASGAITVFVIVYLLNPVNYNYD